MSFRNASGQNPSKRMRDELAEFSLEICGKVVDCYEQHSKILTEQDKDERDSLIFSFRKCSIKDPGAFYKSLAEIHNELPMPQKGMEIIMPDDDRWKKMKGKVSNPSTHDYEMNELYKELRTTLYLACDVLKTIGDFKGELYKKIRDMNPDPEKIAERQDIIKASYIISNVDIDKAREGVRDVIALLAHKKDGQSQALVSFLKDHLDKTFAIIFKEWQPPSSDLYHSPK